MAPHAWIKRVERAAQAITVLLDAIGVVMVMVMVVLEVFGTRLL